MSKLYKYLCNVCKKVFYSSDPCNKCMGCNSKNLTKLLPAEKKKCNENEDFWLDEIESIEEEGF